MVSSMEFVENATIPITIAKEFTALNWDGVTTYQGQWIRSDNPALHIYYQALQRRPGYTMSYEDFRNLVQRPVDHPGGNAEFVITHVPHLSEEMIVARIPHFAAWALTADGVFPVAMVAEPADLGIEQFRDHWPIDEMSGSRVLVIGAGSIGGSAIEALAGYGIGTIDVVDPDRLLFHNTVRHVLGPEYVGRTKVAAMKAAVETRWPTTKVAPHEMDIVEDTHLVHGLFKQADVVLCAADGIAPRRVVSHLSKRHRTTAVLACVLDDGAYGELIRIRPGPLFGCLLCQRADLADNGGIDAEAIQETPYAANTGNHHRPMTAVGPDLHLVGTLAAKVAVATLLQAKGDATQVLPGENAVISLRPSRDIAAPFDLTEAGQIQWHPAALPRPECFTCSTP